STLAGAALADVGSLTDILERIRRVFGVREVALLEREGEEWRVVEAVSDSEQAGPDDAELRVQVSPTLVLSVHGPELFGEDRRVLHSFAEAAAAALQGARLREKAANAAQFEAADRMRTA